MRRLLHVLGTWKEAPQLEIICVNDASPDNTLDKLFEAQKQYKIPIRVVELKKNEGSFTAFLCGLSVAGGNVFTHLVSDLQDPPELIPEMYKRYVAGAPLVVAHRQKRNDGFGNDFFSGFFHAFMRVFSDIKMPSGGTDLVMFGLETKDRLLKDTYAPVHVFYRLMSYGIPCVTIPYERAPRTLGKSSGTTLHK